TGQAAVAGEQADCSEDPPQSGGSVAPGVAPAAPFAYCVDGGDARDRTGEDDSLEPVAAREAPKPDPRGDRAHHPDDPFGYQSLRHRGHRIRCGDRLRPEARVFLVFAHAPVDTAHGVPVAL